MRKKVLFICVHNSARSQMAESFLNHLADNRFEAYSAGLEPGALNPIVVEVMDEVGIDISRNKTKGINEFLGNGQSFDYVITVCDEASAQKCPTFPGRARKLHWSFPDPASFTGTHAEKLNKVRVIRDQIRTKIEEWLEKFNVDRD